MHRARLLHAPMAAVLTALVAGAFAGAAIVLHAPWPLVPFTPLWGVACWLALPAFDDERAEAQRAKGGSK